ncbi:MAG: Hsp20/alpha crystallin family protein [Myxococcales bacterium]
MAEIMIFTADQGDRSPEDEELPPLAFQIVETAGAIELSADVTGFDEDDIEVVLGDGQLTVTGWHEEEEEGGEEGDDAESEGGLGFTQSFALPSGVRASQVQADLDDGVLTIVIEKDEADRVVEPPGMSDGR